MKHLKHIFESTNTEILQDLKDICLEISDMGYDVEVNRERSFFIVNIRKYPNLISYKKMEECIDRMKYYMQLNGYKMLAWIPNPDKRNVSNGWIDSTNCLSFQKLEHQVRITFHE